MHLLSVIQSLFQAESTQNEKKIIKNRKLLTNTDHHATIPWQRDPASPEIIGTLPRPYMDDRASFNITTE